MAIISAGTWISACGATVVPTSTRTFANTQPIVRSGDLLNHGGVVQSASTVIVEGTPVSVVGDLVTSHTVGDTVHNVVADTLATTVNVN